MQHGARGADDVCFTLHKEWQGTLAILHTVCPLKHLVHALCKSSERFLLIAGRWY